MTKDIVDNELVFLKTETTFASLLEVTTSVLLSPSKSHAQRSKTPTSAAKSTWESNLESSKAVPL